MALSAPGAAERSYRAALDLWPLDDPERPYLLLDICRAVNDATNEAPPEAAEARDGLLALGDDAAAAEVEFFMSLGEWVAGNQELAFQHLDRAVELISDKPLSAAQVNILGYAFWAPVLAGLTSGDIVEGERVLELAKRLGDTTVTPRHDDQPRLGSRLPGGRGGRAGTAPRGCRACRADEQHPAEPCVRESRLAA